MGIGRNLGVFNEDSRRMVVALERVALVPAIETMYRYFCPAKVSEDFVYNLFLYKHVFFFICRMLYMTTTLDGQTPQIALVPCKTRLVP